jgi:hypothetical protein
MECVDDRRETAPRLGGSPEREDADDARTERLRGIHRAPRQPLVIVERVGRSEHVLLETLIDFRTTREHVFQQRRRDRHDAHAAPLHRLARGGDFGIGQLDDVLAADQPELRPGEAELLHRIQRRLEVGRELVRDGGESVFHS